MSYSGISLRCLRQCDVPTTAKRLKTATAPRMADAASPSHALSVIAPRRKRPAATSNPTPRTSSGTTIIVRSILFAAGLSLAACKTAHTADFLATPADRLVCEATGARPKIPAEYAIDWSKVTTVAQAKAEHDKYVAVIHDREGIVAAYVLQIEGKLFVCSNNMAWRRDYEAELAKSHAAAKPAP